jgi:cell division protein ZapA
VAHVNVTVNGRAFAITCEDGQEPRIRKLGEYVESKVAKFVDSVGQVGEARLLLLAALVIADELADTEEALRLARKGGNSADARAAPAADAGASDLLAVAKRVEAIAARTETS